MPRAIWNGKVLAESEEFERVEGNIYFPPGSVKEEFFQKSDHTTYCPWKGTASYYNVVVDGEQNANAAWFYPDASAKAKHFENYVAFWNGVTVEE